MSRRLGQEAARDRRLPPICHIGSRNSFTKTLFFVSVAGQIGCLAPRGPVHLLASASSLRSARLPKGQPNKLLLHTSLL